ncbi:MAG TPA: hypothetical protein VJC37_02970 [Planctomycetota bacterium]|nr:hypothetical protein [Planctomycetota bacterium]
MDGLFSHERMAAEILNYLNEGMKGVSVMFDQQKTTQAFLDLAQNYTTTTMQVMRTSMEMYEKTLDTMMKQGALAQEEGQKLLSDWTNKAKLGQKNYMDIMDDNIKKMSAFCCTNKCNTEKKRASAG